MSSICVLSRLLIFSIYRVETEAIQSSHLNLILLLLSTFFSPNPLHPIASLLSKSVNHLESLHSLNLSALPLHELDNYIQHEQFRKPLNLLSQFKPPSFLCPINLHGIPRMIEAARLHSLVEIAKILSCSEERSWRNDESRAKGDRLTSTEEYLVSTSSLFLPSSSELWLISCPFISFSIHSTFAQSRSTLPILYLASAILHLFELSKSKVTARFVPSRKTGFAHIGEIVENDLFAISQL